MISRFNKSSLFWSKLLATASIGLAVTTGVPATANAQDAFDTIQFGLTGGTDVVDTRLHETWTIPGIAELSLVTPFYIGEASIRVTYLPASSRSVDVTDFWALYSGAGLALPFEVSDRVQLSPEFRFGSMYMNFADETVNFRKEESEIFIGGRLALSAAVSNRTNVELSTTLLHTFTNAPITVSTINVGVQYKIETPGWLKRVLQ